MMDMVEKVVPIEDDKSLGQYLSRMRKRKNIDLKNIAVTTRINYNVLLSLENDVFENLPNRTYLRGFIRCLVKEIEADEDHALNLLDKYWAKTTQSPSEEGQGSFESIHINSTLDRDFTKLENLKKKVYKIPIKYLVAALLGLICIGTGFLFLKKVFIATNQEANIIRETNRVAQPVDEVRAPVTQIKKSPPPAVKDEMLLKEDQTTLEQEVENTEEVKMAVPPKPGPSTALPSPTMDPPDIRTDLPRRVLQITPKPITLTQMQYPLYSLDPHHPKLKDETLFPQRIRKAYTPGEEHVFINAARGDTWLVYKNSDDDAKNFILRQGRTLFLRGREIRLFLGNLNAIDIFYNNQYLKAKTINGVRSLIFPHKLAKESEIPFFIYDSKKGKYYSIQDFIDKNQKEDGPTLPVEES